MADKPSLRLVGPNEQPPANPAAAPPVESVAPPVLDAAPMPDGPERLEYAAAVGALDARRQAGARRIVLVGGRLVAGALDLRRRAARHAPERFHRGVTPGERTAEASAAMLRALSADVEGGAYDADGVRFAADDAAEELDKACRVAAEVGLDPAPERRALFRQAASFLRVAEPPARSTPAGTAQPSAPLLLLGASCVPRARRRSEERNVFLAAAGGVLVGAVITTILL